MELRHNQELHPASTENMEKDSEDLKFLRFARDYLQEHLDKKAYSNDDFMLWNLKGDIEKRIQEVEMRDWNI